MLRCLRTALVAVVILLPSAVWALEVVLRAPGGGVVAEGTFLSFDGRFYRIDTRYGPLTIDGASLTCTGPGCPDPATHLPELRIIGAADMGRALLPALIEAFALRKGYMSARSESEIREGVARVSYLLSRRDEGGPVMRVTLDLSTTEAGFAALINGEADLVMARREPDAGERARARAAGMGDLSDANRSFVLALDALVPVVARANPLRVISPQDLAAVLSGEITNWQSLSGPDAPISVHLLAPQHGQVQALEGKLLSPAEAETSAAHTRHQHPQALAQAVARDPFALGLASHAHSNDTRSLLLLGPCKRGIEAHALSIKTEDYPLTTPVLLYAPARRLPPPAREFLRFVETAFAQRVIARTGFVDQTLENIPISQQGQRFHNALAIAGEDVPLTEASRMAHGLAGMSRLSLSFRFQTGSVRLDAQSRENVGKLAQALEAGRFEGHELVFVGFSDGQGRWQDNLQIAQDRAETVFGSVWSNAAEVDLQATQLTTMAFGEAMPMACDTSPWGRQTNRRVEVWVKHNSRK